MLRRIVDELRHFAGLLMFIIAGIVFLIPSVVAAAVFATVSVLCIAVVSVGGILGAVCFVPVMLLTPGCIDHMMKTMEAETK